ncbi:MAG TPA: CCA tRNA nucleotidyltransferase [Gemmatimonadales bacterium]|nr:CCA tRNA nucleotidyltransferase [Gemmatimonadales bacterium]
MPDEVLAIARTLDQAGYEVWCVGGAVRDAILGASGAAGRVEASDIDFTTSARPEEVQRLFRRTINIGAKYGTVGVLDRNRVLHEVTTFRHDVQTDGRHAVVEYGASLEEDLARRDFTINAIAYHPIRREWRDPFGGAADLAAGVVRAVGEPSARFREDYLRILRALRFAARFGFALDPATWEAARAAAPGMRQLSAERVRDELSKSLRTARSIEHLVTLWREVGAAAQLVPELETGGGPYVAAEADRQPRDPVLLTALLCASPSAVLRRLRGSNDEVARAEAIERGPAEPAALDAEAVRRWLARVRGAADDLMALWRLRHGTTAPWAGTVAEIRERGDALTRGQLALNGADLQALGIPRGPRIGELLDALLDRVLADPALNTRERLTALVQELA